MRNDLQSMNVGKSLAQASHCSNAFIHKFGALPEVKEWQADTTQGFGTAIVLAANMAEIREAFNKAAKSGLLTECVVDPEYSYKTSPEIASLIDPVEYDSAPRVVGSDSVTLYRREITCAYVFGEKEDNRVIEAVGKLKLHP